MRAMATGCPFGPRWRACICGTCWASPAVWPCGSARRAWAGRRYTRGVTAASVGAIQAAQWAAQQPRHAWRPVRWRNQSQRLWAAQFVAVRVTPVGLWRHHQRFAEEWLLCQRPTGATTASAHDRYFVSNLPATTSLPALVRAAHQRWAIEQQYQELKTELGLDHFEGRSYPGWQHHVVITAIAYAFLQQGTHAIAPRSAADAAAGLRDRPRDLHRSPLYQPAAVHALDATRGNPLPSAPDLERI